MLDIKVFGDVCQVYGTNAQKVFFEGSLSDCRKYISKIKSKANRKARHEVMTSLGLTRVKGMLGGTYYE